MMATFLNSRMNSMTFNLSSNQNDFICIDGQCTTTVHIKVNESEWGNGAGMSSLVMAPKT